MSHLKRMINAFNHRGKMALRAFMAKEYAALSYSQYGEDMVLRAIFARYPSTYRGFYVEVGAHHPMRFSNTCYFYEKYWRGICIDPIPGGTKLFARYRPRDIFLDIGISKNEGEMTYYIYDEYALNTFSKETVERISHKVSQEKKVKTLPLSKVLDKWLPTGQVIDFLSIDTEGLDMEVLCSNNWAKYRPRVVVVEEMALQSFSDIFNSETHILLTKHGYEGISRIPSGLFYVDSTSPAYDGGAYLNRT